MSARLLRMFSTIALFLISAHGALAPPTASADGRLLHWDNCSPPGHGGSLTKVDACTTEEGYVDLVAGFYLDSIRDLTTGLNAVLELGGGDRFFQGTLVGPDYDPLPQYWHVQQGGCRAGQATVWFDFGSPPFNQCADPWLGSPGSPQVEIDYPVIPAPGATPRLRITISGSWSERTMGPSEYYAFRVRFSRGEGDCEGCCLPMTAHVVSMTISRSNGQTIGLGTDSDTVVWNETSSPSCGVTEALRSTWGAIKEIYR